MLGNVLEIIIFEAIFSFDIDNKLSFNYQQLFELYFFLSTCKLCKSGLRIIYYVSETVRHMNIVYVGFHLALGYTRNLISTVCYFFFSYFVSLINCRDWFFNLYVRRISKMFRDWGIIYI